MITAESKIEFTRSALSNADSLVRWVIVLNGAAAAGLLTFLGNSIDKQSAFHDWQLFGNSLLLFGSGIGFALICSISKLVALNFISQEQTPSENATKEELEIYLLVGDRAAISSIVCFVALLIALSLFAVGIYVGKVAIFG